MAGVLLEMVRRAGYAIVSTHSIIEAKPLPPNTLAQKAELIALTQALILGEGKIINIYLVSKYTFLILHAHTAIWKEKILLNVRNSPVKYETEILHLIEVVQKPKHVAVIHCHEHQKGNSQNFLRKRQSRSGSKVSSPDAHK